MDITIKEFEDEQTKLPEVGRKNVVRKPIPLPSVQTKFFFGTESGDVVYADLLMNKATEASKNNGECWWV